VVQKNQSSEAADFTCLKPPPWDQRSQSANPSFHSSSFRRKRYLKYDSYIAASASEGSVLSELAFSIAASEGSDIYNTTVT